MLLCSLRLEAAFLTPGLLLDCCWTAGDRLACIATTLALWPAKRDHKAPTAFFRLQHSLQLSNMNKLFKGVTGVLASCIH